MVGKAILNWFLSMQSQNVSLSVAIIQEKALTFAKKLYVENFQVSDDWLRRWKKETKQPSRLYQGNRNLLHQNWLMGGGKRLFQLFCKTTS